MAEPPPVNFGEALRDGFKSVNAWVGTGIAWLDDIQAFYRERALIEKEYAGKLNALAKKYHEKKSKKSVPLTAGETPTITPGSLENASLTTWTTILSNTEQLATEHDNLSTALTVKVCNVLEAIRTRYEDFRIRHEGLAKKLVAQRDEVYGDLAKIKEKYDGACKLVEERRQKIDKSFDASKGKAQKAYVAEQAEMANVKNNYILQISVANRHKKRYYFEDLPEVLNSLQDLNETRVTRLNNLWTFSTQLEVNCYQSSVKLLEAQIASIARNVPTMDSGMFVMHNTAVWTEPADFDFEPSPIWHDNPNMVADEQAKIYLRNLLQKSKRGIEGHKGDVMRRQKEIGDLAAQRERAKLDENNAQAEIDSTRALIYMQEELIAPASKLLRFEVEVEGITSTVGDLTRGTQSHTFKQTSFKIPTTCDLCFEKIWGMSAKGSKCTDCGYTAHAKCEMKVPAACPGVLDKAAKKKLKEEHRAAAVAGNGTDGSDLDLTRSNTITSVSSGHGPVKAPSISGMSSTSGASGPIRRVIAPPPAQYTTAPPESPTTPTAPTHDTATETGRMLYPFTGDGEDQLNVSEGIQVTILEDDGAWMTVRTSSGAEGLVPTSYVERITGGASSSAVELPSHPVSRPVELPVREDSPSPPPPAQPPRNERRILAPPPMLGGGKTGKRGPPPPVRPRGASKRKDPKIKALYSYEPQGDDEIAMEVGEEFVVVERDIGGWVKVRAPDGGEGLVPGTYVEDVPM